MHTTRSAVLASRRRRVGAGLSVVVLAGSALGAGATTSTPSTPSHSASLPNGVHRTGTIGSIDAGAFSKTVATCVYNPAGRLLHVNVGPPKVGSLEGGQEVLWHAALLVNKHGRYVSVPHVSQPSASTLVTWGSTKRPLNPLPSQPGAGRSLRSGAYRASATIAWLYPQKDGIEGTLSNEMSRYRYGPETSRIFRSCNDHRPATGAFGPHQVEAGSTFTLAAPGLLAGAHDADGERLSVADVTVLSGSQKVADLWSRAGSLTVPTMVTDVGKTFTVRFSVADAGGLRSAPQTFTIAVVPSSVPPGSPSALVVTSGLIRDPGDGYPSQLTVSLVWSAPSTGGPVDHYCVDAVLKKASGTPVSPTGTEVGKTCALAASATSASIPVTWDQSTAAQSFLDWTLTAYNAAGASPAAKANVTIPNVVGMTEEHAAPLAESMGLPVDYTAPVQTSNSTQWELVCAQRPASGSAKVAAGSSFTVTAYGKPSPDPQPSPNPCA